MSAITFDTGEVIVASTATLIVAANAQRRSVIIQNLGLLGSPAEGGVGIYIGTSAVTYSSGYFVASGATVTINSRDAIYGITFSANQPVCYLEEYLGD